MNQIDKYHIIKELGKGNMGDVFLVEDVHLKKHYAMKIAYRTKDNIYVDALKSECQLMKNLNDRRIPYIVEYGENDTLAYVVMEYIEGENFQKHLEKNAPLSPTKCIEYAMQICEILSYLQSQSPCIIFRDLKPSNLILDSSGNIRLFDFGAGLECFDKICSPYVVGTYGYAAPEVLKGENIGPYSDIYSLGCIIYYMLSGVDPTLPPFRLDDIDEVTIGVSSHIKEIVKKMTSTAINKRYLNAEETMDALKSVDLKRAPQKMYISYVIYYFLMFSAAAFTGYSLWVCYKSVMPKYEYLIISLSLCLISYGYRFILDKHYANHHFIRKREINLFYTQKRTIGLFSIVLSIFIMTGCMNNHNGKYVDACIVDQYGRNVVIKNGSSYDTDGTVNLHMKLEDDEDYQVYVIRKGKGLDSDEAKIFNLSKKSSNIIE